MIKSTSEKARLLLHYTENIRWSILLSIKILKEAKYPEQNEYWLKSLKEGLKSRKILFEKLEKL